MYKTSLQEKHKTRGIMIEMTEGRITGVEVVVGEGATTGGIISTTDPRTALLTNPTTPRGT